MEKMIISHDEDESIMPLESFLKQELEKLQEIRRGLNNAIKSSCNKNIEIAVNRIDTAISLIIQEITKN